MVTQSAIQSHVHSHEAEEEASYVDGSELPADERASEKRPEESSGQQSPPDFLNHVKPYPKHLSPVNALPRAGGPIVAVQTDTPPKEPG